MDDLITPIKVEVKCYQGIEGREKIYEEVRERVRKLERNKYWYGPYTDDMIKNIFFKGFETKSGEFIVTFMPFGVSCDRQ